MKLCFTTLTEVISLFWIEDSWQFCPGQILGKSSLNVENILKMIGNIYFWWLEMIDYHY